MLASTTCTERSDSQLSTSSESALKSNCSLSAASTESSSPLRTRPRTVGAPSTLSRRSTLLDLKKRVSEAFSAYDLSRAPITPAGTEVRTLIDCNAARDKYWRPLPFISQDQCRDLYLSRNQNGNVEILDTDKSTVLYETNIPLKHRDIPSTIELKSRTSARAVKPSLISKINGQLTVEIDGLAPITFYRARPDCVMPVDCFTATRLPTLRPTSIALLSDKSIQSPVAENDNLTVRFAWKNTTVMGQSGLKLVDLRDNEVLAYFESHHGRFFGHLRVQGSGHFALRMVVSTIIAIKYRIYLHDIDRRDLIAQAKRVTDDVPLGRIKKKSSLPELPTNRFSFVPEESDVEEVEEVANRIAYCQ